MTRTIRPAAETDAAKVLAIYGPFVRHTHTSFELEVPDELEIARRIRETSRTHPWLVCEEDGEVLGYAYATSFRARPAYQWGAETTIYVKEGQRRSGIGRNLYSTLLAVLEIQGFRMAYAAISLPNPASIGLHQALGFETVGVFRRAGYKFGAWHDVGWWQRSICDREDPPEPPTRFRDLVGDTAFTELLAVASHRL